VHVQLNHYTVVVHALLWHQSIKPSIRLYSHEYNYQDICKRLYVLVQKFDTISPQLCSSVGTHIILLCLGVELRICMGNSSMGYTRRKLALGEDGPLVLKVFGPSVVLPPSWTVIPGLGSIVSTWREREGREVGQIGEHMSLLFRNRVGSFMSGGY